MGKPTMKDVAAAAGVDTSTVSRALGLDTRRMLSSDTVQRVLTAAAALGYRPNALARGLRTQRSNTVGMIVPDLTNPFFPPVVRGLEDAFAASGYTLIIANSDNDPDRERAALSSLIDRQVDGLVLATAHIESEGADSEVPSIPTVLVNRRSDRDLVSSVVPHEDAAVREVAIHLADLGHRRVAHIAGPQALSTGRDRRSAFEKACVEAGMGEPAIEVAEAFVVDEGRDACRRLLARGLGITAIFAANDLLAIGALRELRESGITVPDDVSLVGYNDMPLVDLIDPPLTTVQVPQYEMGREAARLLLLELAGDDDGIRGQSVQLPSHLVVRKSTAVARDRPTGS